MVRNQALISALTIIFIAVVLVLMFRAVLPEKYRINENQDYTGFYEPVARNIQAGRGLFLQNNKPAVTYPPGYPLILAGVFDMAKSWDVNEDVVHAGFIVVNMAIISLFIFLLARSIWGSLLSGVIAFSLWITYLPTLWMTKQPDSEIPFMVILYGSFLFMRQALIHKQQAWHIYFMMGSLIGCLMLIRPIAVGYAFVICFILWICGHEFKKRTRLFLMSLVLFGNICIVLPWQMWLYLETGKIVPLCTNGGAALWEGLTFGVNYTFCGRQKALNMPTDIKDLMQDFYDFGISSPQRIIPFLAQEFVQRPTTVIRLYAFKALRSWYATCSQRFEKKLLLLQIPYFMLILWGSAKAWHHSMMVRQYMISAWAIIFYFWGMNILASSIFRYMVPGMGFLFILCPALFLKDCERVALKEA